MKNLRRRIPGQERREQILRCSIEVFAKSNFQRARVADIAASAGISEAMVYKHFPSKKSLFIEVLYHMSERLMCRLEEEVKKEQDPLQAVRQMMKVFSNPTVNPPEEVRVRSKAISEIDDKEIADRLHKDHETFMRFIASLILRGMEQGKVKRDVDVETMVLLLDAVGMFVETLKILSFGDKATVETGLKMTDHLIESMRT
jgi:AcrR family transcriptional regulator